MPLHHIFLIRRNHSLKSPKLNHNISNGCRQGVKASWPLLNNPKCIVDYIHLNTSFQRLFDVFLSTPNTLATFLLLPIDELEANIHKMFLAATSWVCFGPTKWLMIPNFMLFKISWFGLIDCTLARYLGTTFCRIE